MLGAIEQHNGNAATTDEARIEIDVPTGASAGGMTAVICLLLSMAGPFHGSSQAMLSSGSGRSVGSG